MIQLFTAGNTNPMRYLNNTPISNCNCTRMFQQLLYSILLVLLSAAAYCQNNTSFTISTKSGCGELQHVVFQNNSQGDAVINKDWDLGNGTILLNGPDTVSTSYTSPGTYYVRLTATFANGDVLTHTDSVKVYHPATVSIEGETTVCLTADKRLQYTANIICAEPIAGYKWQIDADSVAGTPNLDFNYRIPGTHLLRLTVTTISGCQYSATKTFVVDYVATYFGLTSGRYCGTGTVNFTNYSITIFPLQSWQWSYGDGSTYSGREQAHTYTAPGDYTVKLVATSITGCKDSTIFKDTVHILHLPAATISGPELLCLTPASRLQYSSSISTVDVIRQYKWAVNGSTVASVPNLNTIYTTTGTHELSFNIKTSRGCESTVTKTITIDSIKTNFAANPSRLCGGGEVSFSNLSNNGFPATYHWQFGDGSSYTGKDTVHAYPNIGSYAVKLYGETTNGCKDSTYLPDSIKVFHQPTATISGPGIICLTPATRLQFSSTINSPDAIAAYKWFIDNDSVANTAQLNINYRIPGNHTIRFELVTVNGCNANAEASFTIDSVKTAFTQVNNKLCGSGTVQFNNLSAAATAPVYYWQFGDGSSYTGKDTVHAYTQTGNYTVKLYGETINGCKDSTVVPNLVQVFNQPVISISGDSITCLNTTGNLQYSSTAHSIDPVSSYTWMINGDSIANTAQLNFNYRNTGSHLLQVRLHTIHGCTASANKTILLDSVKAAFTVNRNKICGAGNVLFTNNSTAASPAQYTWQFDDGSTATTIDAAHDYNRIGIYNTALIAVTENGCTDSSTTTAIQVSIQPKIKISGDTVHCSPGRYSYTAQSSAIESIDELQWFINDMPAGNLNTLTPYLHAGVYNIALKATTINDCTDSTSITVIVDSVQASFSTSQYVFCADSATVVYTNQSGAFAPVIGYTWQFGDANTSTAASPVHHYQQPGSYNAKLIITTANGCTDTAVQQQAVSIYKKPFAAIEGSRLHCNTGQYLYKADESNNATGTIYEWTINNVPAGISTTLEYNFTQAGIYLLELSATSPNGCTTSVTDSIIIDSARAFFSVNKNWICADSASIIFTNQSASAFGNSSYSWNFGNGSTGSNNNPVQLYTAGKYQPSLTLTTANGCTAAYTLPDSIAVIAVKASIEGETAGCINTTANYQSVVSANDAIQHYQWTIDGNPAGNSASTTQHFNTSGLRQVQLEVQTASGCNTGTTLPVTIHALPQVQRTADTTVCAGTTLQLHSTGGANYQWQPAAALQNPNTATPTATITANSSFTVKVTSPAGCSSYDTIRVKADAPVLLTLNNNTAICSGSSTPLKASGNAIAYQWDNENTLSNSNSANPIARPLQTTTYRVIGFSGNSCKNDTAFTTVSVGNIPVVDAGPDMMADANDKVNLHVSGTDNNATYTWWPSDGLSCSKCASPSFTADTDVLYTVTATTAYGCVASDTVFIKVNPAKPKLFMPNAFSPNNDGLNDYFYVKGFGLITVKHMIIFNRLGQKVFERYNVPANDPRQGWNGSIGNAPAGDNESFVYALTVIDKNGIEHNLKGTVLILR
ncbi:MAG TPA: PKD domain-containing protein [Ferruginibacter sp.]|nr:PKD domain-containing protein [Ferruginibacter sp.]HMP22013.1 PKD domain-containing protein [Ferruginibacter sp.]